MNINFGDKKIEKTDFYKNKEIFNIDDIDVNKILVSKKNHTANIMHLNTLLDIMAMILLDHYVQGFQIWLFILEKLMKIKIKIQ